MDMTGERRIPAPREVVWQALNDPAVLKASIPGCESLEKISDSQMKATAAVKIGPISARFTGNVQLTDIDPPNGYNIGGEGQGGVAGFAKGGAKVALTDDAGATLLRYQVNAQVGGKIAQLGARLIDATAKQMADAFFTRFSAQVEAAGAPQPQELLATPAMAPPASVSSSGSTTSTSPAAALTPHPATSGAASPPGGEPMRAMAAPAAAPHIPPLPAGRSAAPPAPPSAPVQPPSASPAHAAARAEPPAAISMLSLIPPEPFGLPLAFWIGSGVFTVVVLLVLVSS